YDPTVGRYKKLFSNKKGKGIVDNFMHLFVFDGKKISEITKFEKDCLPMGLFQHGSIKFPKQEYKGLHVFVIAAKRFDGTWLLIDKNKDRIYTAIGDLQ
nr:hypothetical protein [Treponema sp.]